MSTFWRVFLAVALSVASQGILAPVAVWWIVRHYQRPATLKPVRRNGPYYVQRHGRAHGA